MIKGKKYILFLLFTLCLLIPKTYAQVLTTPEPQIISAPVPKVTLITTLPTGRWPKGVEITPDGYKAYVTNFDNYSVSVYDAINFTFLTTIKTPKINPVEVDFSKDSRYAYVTGGMPNKLLKIDTKTDTIVDELNVTNYPKIVVVSPDGSYCYVSNWFSDDLVKVDLSTFTIVGRISTGRCPRGQAFTPDGKYTYVANFGRSRKKEYYEWDTISVIDNESMRVIKDIKTRYNPRHATITPDGKFVYASNRGHNSIAIFEVEGDNGFLNLVGHQPSLGYTPRNLSLSPDDNFLLVANRHSNNIVSFKRDKITGLLKEVDQIEAPTPACIVF